MVKAAMGLARETQTDKEGRSTVGTAKLWRGHVRLHWWAQLRFRSQVAYQGQAQPNGGSDASQRASELPKLQSPRLVAYWPQLELFRHRMQELWSQDGDEVKSTSLPRNPALAKIRTVRRGAMEDSSDAKI
jgi:hypothetical protein